MFRCSAPFSWASFQGLTGEPDGAPMKTGLSLFDLTAGLHGVAFSEFVDEWMRVDEVFNLTLITR